MRWKAYCGASGSPSRSPVKFVLGPMPLPLPKNTELWRRTIAEFRRGYFRAMAFRRFDHMDEIIKITRAIGDSVTVEAAKAKIATFQWLIAHDGPAAMEEDPGDNAKPKARSSRK